MKAVYTLQGFATVYYTAFAVVIYVYLGPGVASPAFLSLPVKRQKGPARNSTSKLPDCWLIIRSYFGEALFHTSVQKFDPSSREYCDWMGNVDGFDRSFKWSSIRPSRWSSDLPLPCRYRCISLRVVVVSCPIS